MINFSSSTAIINELDRQGSSAREQLIAKGWKECRMTAETYCSNKIGREEARVFTRTISIDSKYPEYFARKRKNGVQKNVSLNIMGSNKLSDTATLETGSKNTMGHIDNNFRPHDDLSHINSLLDLPSVKAMRSEQYSLVIALDTEFFYNEKERLILSYQFAFYNPTNHNMIHQCVFFPSVSKRLPFWRMMSWIFTEYNLCDACDFRSTYRWVATVKSRKSKTSRKKFESPQEAYEASIKDEEKALFLAQFDKNKQFCSKNDGGDCGYVRDYSDFHKKDVVNEITLICHFGSADLSTFEIPRYKRNSETGKKDILDVLAKCSEVQGGLVSIFPSYEHPKVIRKWWEFYPVRFYVRDTMCFAPAGQKSLKNLGESISVHKLELPYEAISHMDKYFSVDPVHYMEYAINDSVICLLYSSELWGINKYMEITATAGAAKASLAVIADHFDVYDDENLDLNYRGLQRKCLRKRVTSTPDGLKGFTEDTYYEPVSDDASLIMNTAANAYVGGFNGCLGARYVNSLSHDYDLQNAYPTSMSCITDPDWLSDSLILRTIEKRLLTIEDFISPYDLIFGDIEFEFPEDVLFPCIPVNVNGSVIFPRTSVGLTKCYASGPELWLAVCLGAKVKAKRVYVASERIMPDGSPSRCLYKVCEQSIRDRSVAKAIWGPKSLEQNFIKMSTNSIYGKTAQNIKPKSSWNAALAEMEDIGWSRLTSPVHACLTTSGIRAILNATMNQLSNRGYKCFSVTTDGLITDAPIDVLNSLDLYGLSECFRDARMRLTGSTDMWEEKHTNTSFLNISTRGNVSQDLASGEKKAGVCAHNGFRPFFIDSNGDEVTMEINGALDRYVTMTAVAQRDGRVRSPEKRFTGFKKLSYHGINLEKRKDFISEDGERNLRMDFDMKRKPLESSFEQVFFTVKGVTEEVLVKGSRKKITVPDVLDCEWVNFDSVPYYSVTEYEAYRRVYDSMDCLRTKADWDKFWLKIHSLSSKEIHRRHITDVSWAILISCIMGHRLNFWDIPALSDPTKSVKEKVAWINKFNTSSKKFTESSWKNCRRPDRISQMVSENDCCELLKRMITDSKVA